MTTATGTKLTRAEAAYAHLASFAKGDRVEVSGPRFYQPGYVTTPQHDADVIYDAHLTVTGCGVEARITVQSLLAEGITIASLDDAEAGRTLYFDAATWAMQNPEG